MILFIGLVGIHLVEAHLEPAEGFLDIVWDGLYDVVLEGLVSLNVEEDEEYVNAGGATEVKLFGKWSFDEIEIRDISLEVNMPNCFLLEKRVYMCS